MLPTGSQRTQFADGRKGSVRRTGPSRQSEVREDPGVQASTRRVRCRTRCSAWMPLAPQPDRAEVYTVLRVSPAERRYLCVSARIWAPNRLPKRPMLSARHTSSLKGSASRPDLPNRMRTFRTQAVGSGAIWNTAVARVAERLQLRARGMRAYIICSLCA